MNNTFSSASVVLLALAFLAAGDAQAGNRNTRVGSVIIRADGAEGVLSAVRNSADTHEYINCTIRSSQSATCLAHDAARQTRACNTTVAEMRRVIGTIRGDSYVAFTVNAEGVCTSVSVTTGSREEPKRL